MRYYNYPLYVITRLLPPPPPCTNAPLRFQDIIVLTSYFIIGVSAVGEDRLDVPDDADEPTPVPGRGLRRNGRQVLRIRDGRGQPGGDRSS